MKKFIFLKKTIFVFLFVLLCNQKANAEIDLFSHDIVSVSNPLLLSYSKSAYIYSDNIKGIPVSSGGFPATYAFGGEIEAGLRGAIISLNLQVPLNKEKGLFSDVLYSSTPMIIKFARMRTWDIDTDTDYKNYNGLIFEGKDSTKGGTLRLGIGYFIETFDGNNHQSDEKDKKFYISIGLGS
ncbi:MAG: hypothetical protein DRQ51_10265 [Gammaproteobacteria bacterium]|nr:MAG: hypothetical protein DRQ51_10265 [Gammaproteobacteria bacterium]